MLSIFELSCLWQYTAPTSPSVILTQALKLKYERIVLSLENSQVYSLDNFIWGPKHLMEKSRNLEEAEGGQLILVLVVHFPQKQ